jgi:hypothetical protein
MVCLAAIAKLTQLTALMLTYSKGLQQRGLMMLTTLSCLQQLDVYENQEDEKLPEEILQQFWSAVRRQQQQQQPA